MVYIEENFDEIFLKIYEHEFVDRIFMEHEAIISKDDFKTALAGNLNEVAKCDWLFCPTQIRNMLQLHIDAE